jgi:site-specific DNA recombinase
MKENSVRTSSALASGTPKNVGIWIRVSTEDQAQGESPQHHLHRARAYAESKGWTVREVYDLAGVSGKSVIEHAEAKRMLADIKRGHVTGLIFSKLARLARNTKELLDFADIFRLHSADLISLQESIDTSTPAGRLFYTMIAAMAQWEREEIAERVRSSVSVRAKLGKPLSGVSPFGYRWKDKKLVIDEKEAPVRKLVFELFLEHRRKGVVARLLNEAGHRTRAGARWSDMAVHRTLQDTSAKGVYFLNRTKQTGNWTWEMKPESEWSQITLVPIVSESLWTQCNQLLEGQTKKEKRLGKKPVHLLAGLAFCVCGHKMYVRSNSPKYVCLKCKNKIPIVDLEGILYDELKAFFTAPQKIASYLQDSGQRLADKEALLAAQEREIARIQEEMERTHRLYLEQQISAEGFGKFYKPLEERLNQLQADVPKLQADVDLLKVNNLSTEEVVHEADLLYSRWPSLPADDKRKIVESLVESIKVGIPDIEITFSYLPSSEEMTKAQQALSVP